MAEVAQGQAGTAKEHAKHDESFVEADGAKDDAQTHDDAEDDGHKAEDGEDPADDGGFVVEEDADADEEGEQDDAEGWGEADEVGQGEAGVDGGILGDHKKPGSKEGQPDKEVGDGGVFFGWFGVGVHVGAVGTLLPGAFFDFTHFLFH